MGSPHCRAKRRADCPREEQGNPEPLQPHRLKEADPSFVVRYAESYFDRVHAVEQFVLDPRDDVPDLGADEIMISV
jgi:hypothetical protein